MRVSRTCLLRALALTVGCLAKFSSGSIFAFNIYSNAVKASFNYTQTEVEFLASMMNLGLGVGLPAGMVFDRFGPIITSLVGLLSTSIGYVLIWSAFSHKVFYANRNALLAFYFFIVGHGSLYTYMSALGTNVSNFPSKHRGKIIGLLDACFGGSPAIFVLIYSAFFINGHVKDEENQNVAGFMLLFSIWFGLTNILCVLFLRIYPPEDSLNDNSFKPISEEIIPSIPSDKNTVSPEHCVEARTNRPVKPVGPDLNGEVSINGPMSPNLNGEVSINGPIGTNVQDEARSNRPVSPNLNSEASINGPVIDDKIATLRELSQWRQIIRLFTNWTFEYLLWIFIFASVVGLALVNNTTLVTRSVYLSKYDAVITPIVPVSGILARFTLGPLSDHVKERFPRVNVLLFTNTLFVASQLICVFWADREWVFIIANVGSGMAIGCLWTFVPAIVSEMFGLKDFGRNWGIMILLAALAGIGMQEVYGLIYESFISDPQSTDCFGLICVKWNFVLMVGIVSCATFLNLFLVLILRRGKR